MKKLGFATVAATALTAGFLGLAAPALAAPTGSGSAQHTIASLEAQGYHVVVNRLSNAPLDKANVVSVGKGATFTHSDTNAKNNQHYGGHDHEFAPDNQTTVYVDVR